MRMKLIYSLFLLPLLLSCSDARQAPIPPARMQAVLGDIHIAESYSVFLKQDSLHKAKERNPDSLAVFYRSVFRHHGITPEQFNEGINWYRMHPEELDSIYTRMIPEITRLDALYN
jgi:hypothetical protein